MNSDLIFYNSLLNEIKNRIRQAQIRAVISANAEMILMYKDIGRMIHQRQQMEGWGAGIIPRLARDAKGSLSFRLPDQALQRTRKSRALNLAVR